MKDGVEFETAHLHRPVKKGNAVFGILKYDTGIVESRMKAIRPYSNEEVYMPIMSEAQYRLHIHVSCRLKF
jgi:hypothetical protein